MNYLKTNLDQLSIAYAFMHHVLPAALITLGSAVCWLAVCQLIRRAAQQRHRVAISSLESYEGMPLDERLSIASKLRGLESRGTPVDRLFFFGLAAASILCLAYFGLWSVGVLPASNQERDFINRLRVSEFARQPHVASVIAAADNSIYISRRHFFAAEKAFNRQVGTQ